MNERNSNHSDAMADPRPFVAHLEAAGAEV